MSSLCLSTIADLETPPHHLFQIVFNPSTYPNFLRFLHLHPTLADAIQPTSMTFSVSRNFGLFEWAGNEHGLRAFFTSWRRVLDGRMWRLAYDILRFNACARRLVIRGGGEGEDDEEKLSIGEYLEREGYSDTFRDDYLIVRLPITLPLNIHLCTVYLLRI